MKPAPKAMMYRKDLVQWLGEAGYTETQVRRLIKTRVIRGYSWRELLGNAECRCATLPRWTVFLEEQVKKALGELVLTTEDTESTEEVRR